MMLPKDKFEWTIEYTRTISSSASCLLFVQSQYQRQSIWLGKKAVLSCVGSCLLSAFVFEEDLLHLTHPCCFLKVYRWSKVTLASSVPETLKVTVVFSVFFFSFMLCFNMFRIGSKRPTHVARGYDKAMRIGSNVKVSGKTSMM